MRPDSQKFFAEPWAGSLFFKKAAACFALILLCGATPLKLERMVLLMRHGVRPPTKTPPMDPAIAPDAWPVWEVQDGYLTPHGAAAIKLLAAYDRKIFGAGCAELAIYADVDERTVATGAAYAAGFGCPDVVVAHAAAEKDLLFSPLDTPSPAFDAKAAKAQMLEAVAANPAPAALIQEMQATLAPGQTAFETLPVKISAKAAGEIPKLTGPIAQGSTAGEDFLLEYLDDKPMAEVAWGRLDEAGVARLLAFHPLAYTITARPPLIARATAAALAGRIAQGLARGPEVQVLVGHDTNQADLAGLLGLHWQVAGYPADDPPPGGGLLFSLLTDGKAQYVTLRYQVQPMDAIRNLTPEVVVQPLPIPGCGTPCTLNAFEGLISKVTAK